MREKVGKIKRLKDTYEDLGIYRKCYFFTFRDSFKQNKEAFYYQKILVSKYFLVLFSFHTGRGSDLFPFIWRIRSHVNVHLLKMQ